MNSDLVTLLPLFFGIAIVAVAAITATRSAAHGNLARNSSIGIRTRHTQVSGEAWLAGHAAALPLMKLTGWVAVATIVLAIAAGTAFNTTWSITIALIGLTLEVAVVLWATAIATRAALSVIDPTANHNRS